eukprot:scaffold14703_cov175-Ochromonas_danica.AAC.1
MTCKYVESLSSSYKKLLRQWFALILDQNGLVDHQRKSIFHHHHHDQVDHRQYGLPLLLVDRRGYAGRIHVMVVVDDHGVIAVKIEQKAKEKSEYYYK